MFNLKLVINVDDVVPCRNFKIIGEQTEKWFNSLHKDFGCHFNLFLPSNYHRHYPLTEHKSWLNDLGSDPKYELCCHGHFHQTTNPTAYGECEWFEIQDKVQAIERFKLMEDEWMNALGYLPKGWRSPGWLISPQCKSVIETKFEYVAIHYEHNQGMEWNCKTFFGHDGIQMENISIHNDDMIMYQSHIAGTHNHNVWNEHNYEQLHLSLTHLFESHNITPKLLKECIEG